MNCPSCQAENDASSAACVRCGATLPGTPTEIVVTIDLKPGSIFHSRYEILGPLGRGGMGMVYKARDRSLEEVVAIKILRPDFAQDPKMAERFKTEIRLARKVRHRNVCTIHDYGEDRGLLYISMEFMEGVDLKHVLRDTGPLPPAEGYDIAIQVAEGLQAVHEAGIIHRDLKTPNIMRDAQGVARLMDFGIAKRQGDGTLTATGNIVGTPEYMSPEQAQGQKVDFRSDVYALGIVTYEIFTGAVPFRGDTPISTILKHLHDPPPLDGPAAARLPADLRPVLRKALAKEPAERYASARDFAEALRQARSPSRKQQPIPTEVLQAPTLPRARPAPTRGLQPWLLVVPVATLAGGLALWQRASSPVAVPSPSLASAASPPLSMAAVSPAATSASLVEPPSTQAPEVAVAATALPRTPRPATPRPTPSPTKRPSPTAAPIVPATVAPSPTAAPPSPPPAAVEGTGFLLVVVRPWASVTVDARSLGETPLDQISLPAGAHVVRVRHPAYEPVERKVTIRPGQVERLVVDLPTEGVKKQ